MHRAIETTLDSPSPRRLWTCSKAARLFIAYALLPILLQITSGCCAAPDESATLRAELDTAIARAVTYIQSQQEEDGSFPSQTYGLFRDGVALTPHVMRSLAVADQSNAGMKIGFDFLAQQVRWTRSHPSRTSLSSAVQGPVYFLVDTQLATEYCPEQAHSKLRQVRVGLMRLQIRDSGSTAFAQEGGWGYGNRAFSGVPTGFDGFLGQFDHGQSPTPIFPDLSANISATAYALDAIRSPMLAPLLPHETQSKAYQQHVRSLEAALRFAERCQNHSTGDDRFDDGGFFFNPADAARNKGGPAGTDRNGYARFHSSGSSTADGLRVLLRCLLSKDDPRIVAARDWLFEHFDPAHNPGLFNDDREVLRDAYYFYYTASVADTFTLLGEGPGGWAEQLAGVLLQKQQADGSFLNPFTDGKEDDPLVATPFALRAMVACRAALRD